MDAIDMLQEQHRLVERLYDRLGALDEDEPGRALMAIRICDVLAVHIAIEESIFYPAVRARATEEVLLDVRESHLQIKRLVLDLSELVEPGPPRGAELDAKLRVLEEELEHHFGDEEDRLWPAARELLTEDELEGLASEMAERETEIEERGEARYRVFGELEHMQ
jgi:hypothetical protein